MVLEIKEEGRTCNEKIKKVEGALVEVPRVNYRERRRLKYLTYIVVGMACCKYSDMGRLTQEGPAEEPDQTSHTNDYRMS